MAKAAAQQRARAPQGAKRVAQAFFDELSTIAEDKQAEVGKAAQAMVRETMVVRRDKAKAAKAKLPAGRAAPSRGKPGPKPARKMSGPARGRKASPTRRARSSQPASDNAADTAEPGGES